MIQSSLSTPITSTAATLAALTDLSCITESLQLVESITRDWLKTESQKPTPPTPPDLQPAVHTLWRCSTIRKNLLGVAKSPTPPTDPTAPGRSQFNPETASEAAIIRSLEAISAPKLMDLVSRKLVQHTNTEIKAIQARRESTAPATITPSIQSIQSTPSTLSTQSTSSAAPYTHPISVPPAPHRAQPIPAQPLPSVSSIRNSSFAIRNSPSAIRNSPSAQTPLPADSSLPPKFRYPPPKRVSV